MRIAIDAMGGEGGLDVTLPAALQALEQFPSLHLLLIGHEQEILERLSSSPQHLRQRLELEPSNQLIIDSDRPLRVLRSKRQSSMARAIDAVAENRADAAVSAGNTGALLLLARHILKTLPGIDKPALVASIPSGENDLRRPISDTESVAEQQGLLLDVGANPDCSAQQLHQFAVIGAAMHSILNVPRNQHANPRVALLNIGAEVYKGSENTLKAAQLMSRDAKLNYLGFVEGDELFSGVADVLVCDGFVGNVTIKSAAGVARLLSGFMSANEFAQVNPGRLNGAMIIGLNGNVVKSHGKADHQGFFYAINQARCQIENNLPHQLSEKLAVNLQA